MSNRQQRYISYLLRLWQTEDGGRQVWRCSLESPGTGERRGFAGLQELFDFLRTQIEIPPYHPSDPCLRVGATFQDPCSHWKSSPDNKTHCLSRDFPGDLDLSDSD